MIPDQNYLEAEERLKLYASAFEHALECMILLDDKHKLIAANPSFEKITGFTLGDILGRRATFLVSGEKQTGFYKRMWKSVHNDGSWQGEVASRRKDGEIYPQWLSLTRIHHGKDRYYLAVFTDISHREEYEQALFTMANYDTLTGLPNRNLFTEKLDDAIARSKKTHTKLGLLILDLDRFKSIRMTLGHDVSDELLLEVVGRIKSCMSPRSSLFRLGGDEFALIQEGIGKQADAAHLAREILHTMSRVFLSTNYERYVTCSIGLAIFPDDSMDARFLHKNADTANFRAKSRGRNNYQVYGIEMHVDTFEQLILENSLRAALARNEFRLHFQPIVHAQTGKLARMESLVRWNHPELGMIQPDVFIQSAEETGLIFQLGEWVLREACAQYARWRIGGINLPIVSVNVSAVQLRKMNLFSIVASAIQENKMMPRQLDLEITESFAMQNAELSLGFLEDLGGLGVGLSIDDFGVGYSSLAYLKRLPIHTLKIDRSFIRDVPDDADSKAIANAIVAMAHSLDLGVVAEGVESERQMHYLKSIDCDELQGYYFSRPMPPEEIDFAKF